ncbi:hypothetical protein, variant 2 [Phytophthora nicotianae P10297]|uniref:Uncharacterized protein n=2 Tax=Phytophthora nicotianae TaxID=4792 RepID=W2Z951_PHYNI|nr:hypothetical protein PPTG_19914 [Phytophthora nicotianae INRA-310]ETM97910.1 hypothetical protein PPTG_19914 [Phytophthora nicotianae INRA-310]ETP43505.1 hypothetical protein F442_09776 [Phytophthora nicotianae P10297]ETP43506.1 hypothetical protein, variant 1 [Phytophthora nicotianae P10297]ETP43507.1 hypothetical protein, variant 2 [Phytophthora nicotianae P10297]
MSWQSLTGHKRRIPDEWVQQQTPVRHRRIQHCQGNNQQIEDGNCGNQTGKGKSGTFLLSSPTDVSDAAAVQQIRAKQAKANGLPNLSLSPAAELVVTEADRVAKDEEASELEEDVEAGALTPRPTIPRRTVPRPPLSRRRAVGVNRARFGVGIVRCRNWKLNEEDTETEDESSESSPLRENSKAAKFLTNCGYSEDCDSEKLEDKVSASVLPIDPTLACFDRSFSEDQWQLRSPSPDEKFVPENSCCGATTVENTECGSDICKPTPIHAVHVESTSKY